LVLELPRERTALLHVRAEKARDLPAHCESLRAYRRVVVRLPGFYPPIERQLGGICFADVGLTLTGVRPDGREEWLARRGVINE
jgi:hypothetical protein